MHIRVDDEVEVLTGDDRETRGKVLKVLKAENKVLIEGVNRVFKHVRRSRRNPQGGRLSKEMPVQLSNVALVCQSCNEPTRVGFRYEDDGAKIRYCKKCGAAISTISPPRPKYAKQK